MGLQGFYCQPVHFIHFIHGPTSTMCRLQSEEFSVDDQPSQTKQYQSDIMSQEEQTILVPIPMVYTAKQEMLNGNGESELVPQPQPGMPIQGVQDEG